MLERIHGVTEALFTLYIAHFHSKVLYETFYYQKCWNYNEKSINKMLPSESQAWYRFEYYKKKFNDIVAPIYKI